MARTITASSGTITSDANKGNSQFEAKILLNYDAALKTDKSAGSWFYNENDGYFYWMSALASGASTANLLDSVTFGGGLGKPYQKMQFELAITVEAIQAKKAAISDSDGGGWNITDTTFAALLQALCDDYVAP